MNDLRQEVGMQCSLPGRLVRSSARRAGHLVRMDEGRLAESRGGKTSRTQEKGKATAEMGGPREEGYDMIGGRMKDGEGGCQYKTVERKHRKSGTTILKLYMTCTAGNNEEGPINLRKL